MRYLLEEHIDPAYSTQLVRADPDLQVWIIGDPGAPARGTLDPDILVGSTNKLRDKFGAPCSRQLW